MKLVFLSYTNVVDHHFNRDLPLETMFFLHHPYATAEISLISDSEHTINRYLKLKAYSSPALALTPWSPTPKNLKLYVNGVHFWKLTDNGLLVLHERDIIEIILSEPETESLTHQIIVITSVSQ